MKKRALMAFPKLTATEEMKQIAASDMPRKEKTKYGYVTEVCDYYVYLRCVVQAGILKAALFFPDYLRLDGNNPVYEVYLDKENRQFTTYDCLNQKWSEAKLDRLFCNGSRCSSAGWRPYSPSGSSPLEVPAPAPDLYPMGRFPADVAAPAVRHGQPSGTAGSHLLLFYHCLNMSV